MLKLFLTFSTRSVQVGEVEQTFIYLTRTGNLPWAVAAFCTAILLILTNHHLYILYQNA